MQRAFASTSIVLSKVSPEQITNSTPCASWTVRELVNHIVGGSTFFTITAETGAAPTRAVDGRTGGRGEVPDFAAGDFTTPFDEGAKRAVTAFSADGVMDKTMRLPFGDPPGGMFVLVAAVDTFTHGWDLAQATGQATDLDPTLATRLLENARAALPDERRGPEGQAPFGPRVEIAEPSCPADELAGLLVRQP